MPVCSYVVVPRQGQKEVLRQKLSALPGCNVVPAGNADLLLLVTDADSFEADGDLRRRVEALPGIQALLLTFGEVSAEAGDILANDDGRTTPGPGRTVPGDGSERTGVHQPGGPQ